MNKAELITRLRSTRSRVRAAKVVQCLIAEHGMTQTKVAKAAGKSLGWINAMARWDPATQASPWPTTRAERFQRVEKSRYKRRNRKRREAQKDRKTKSDWPALSLKGRPASMLPYDHPAVMESRTIYPSNGFYAAIRRKIEASGGSFEPILTAATKVAGDAVEIRIRDNGTGIPAEIREKIFNPFFTTKPTGEGTGLGLSMAHDIIVKQHGGTIDIVTEPGVFTEFIVTLPRGNGNVGWPEVRINALILGCQKLGPISDKCRYQLRRDIPGFWSRRALGEVRRVLPRVWSKYRWQADRQPSYRARRR